MNPNSLYPFDFSKGGGAFIATASSPIYVSMPANSLVKSYHWHSSKYTLLITAIGLQFDVIASSTPGWVKLKMNKVKDVTVRNSGGTLVTEYATPKRTSMMSNKELMTYFEVRLANAGGTGLTKGTRTISPTLLGKSFYSKDIGISSVSAIQELDFSQGDTLFIEDNEGIETSFEAALPTGLSLVVQSTLRLVVLPNEVVRDYF